MEAKTITWVVMQFDAALKGRAVSFFIAALQIDEKLVARAAVTLSG
jgi:hypothetical protein